MTRCEQERTQVQEEGATPQSQGDGTVAQGTPATGILRDAGRADDVDWATVGSAASDVTAASAEAAAAEVDPDAAADAEAKALAKRRRKQKNAISDFFIKLAVFVVAVWAVFTFVLDVYRASGQAMYPSIRDGDVVLAFRLDCDLVATDVATYEVGGARRTGRVVAVGGDVVDLTDDGQLVVNGAIQDEQIFFETNPSVGGIEYPYTVPQQSYFMLCDYRTEAIDSRMHGAVQQQDITGKVIGIFRRRGI